MIKIINAQVFNEEGYFLPGEVTINNARFSSVTYDRNMSREIKAPYRAYKPNVPNEPNEQNAPNEPNKPNAPSASDNDIAALAGEARSPSVDMTVIDASGCYAIPGLIDIHLHGCVGYNFYDAEPEGHIKMLQYLAANGVTAVCPTTLTLPEDVLMRACKNVVAMEQRINDKRLADAPDSGLKTPESISAAPVGIYLEGPFFSPSRAGAQNPAYVVPPDVGMFRRLAQASNGLVKIIALSPEVEGATEFIRSVADEVTVSIAHTNIDYEACVAAFAMGAKHATHLYNAMKPLTNRTPNAVGAVLDCPDITAELICDGLHLHPAIVRTAMRLLGPARAVFISDSMMAAGLGDGMYDLGGLSVNVKKKEARLTEGGNIAGSVSNLTDCVRVAVKEMGVPLADAVRCASVNPARVIGLADERGRIAEGAIADLVLLDRDLNIKEVFVRGRQLN